MASTEDCRSKLISLTIGISWLDLLLFALICYAREYD